MFAINGNGDFLQIFENATILQSDIASEMEVSLIGKHNFSIKMLIFCQTIFSPLGEVKPLRMISWDFISWTNWTFLLEEMRKT